MNSVDQRRLAEQIRQLRQDEWARRHSHEDLDRRLSRTGWALVVLYGVVGVTLLRWAVS